MKRCGWTILTAVAVAGCTEIKSKGKDPVPLAEPAPVYSTHAPVAQLGSASVSFDQFYTPLVESHGLPLLINLSMLELAKQKCSDAGLTVTDSDLQAEHKLTFAKLFEQADERDYNTLFEQFLTRQRLSKSEFRVIETLNAHLRKLAAPKIVGRFTEKELRQAFGARYGETVRILHIQGANPNEINAARRRIAAGETFEDVAKSMSRNLRSGSLNGEWPPFSREDQTTPQAFKDVAFQLNLNEVSGMIEAEGGYHIIKLIEKIPPKAVKFEDMKDSVKAWLEDLAISQEINFLRKELSSRMVQVIKINDPILRKQFDEKIQNLQTIAKAEEAARHDVERAASSQPTTEPAAPPATSPATAPAGAPTTAPSAHP